MGEALRRCPECEFEHRESALVCPNCGLALFGQGESATADEGLPPLEALLLLRVAHVGWAQSLSERLQAAGVPHRIAAENAGSADALRFGVFIRGEDREAALAVDAEVLREQLPDLPEGFDPGALQEGGCPACGAAVGTDERECPECGLALIDA